jgi:hypothetical protein
MAAASMKPARLFFAEPTRRVLRQLPTVFPDTTLRSFWTSTNISSSGTGWAVDRWKVDREALPSGVAFAWRAHHSRRPLHLPPVLPRSPRCGDAGDPSSLPLFGLQTADLI